MATGRLVKNLLKSCKNFFKVRFGVLHVITIVFCDFENFESISKISDVILKISMVYTQIVTWAF